MSTRGTNHSYRLPDEPHVIEIRGYTFIEHQSSVANRRNASQVRGKLPERRYAVYGERFPYTRQGLIDWIERRQRGKLK